MAHLSKKERIVILMMRGFGDRVRSFQEVADLFNATFPDRNPIVKSTVQKTIKRFEETDTIQDKVKTGRPKSATNETKSLETLQMFIENPHTSIRNVAEAVDVSSSSIERILDTYKFYPYKIHLAQELSEDDFDRRMEFCDVMMRRLDENEDFSKCIVFSDEATFMLNGVVNRHNCRYWSDENPHWMREVRTQNPQKLNVWAGLFGRQIVGPFFIEGNLTSEKYLDMLQNVIVPEIQNLAAPNFGNIWYQQDGAPPHYGHAVREYLDRTFPNKWIGRRGSIEWPPRSPDLSPLDYFFWGHLKNVIYKTKPESLADLRNRIHQEAARITADMIQNSIQKFYFQLAHCQAAQGKQFEHLFR
jgi:transposase